MRRRIVSMSANNGEPEERTMTKAVCGTAVMLAICASVVLVGWPGQDAAVRTERLNPRIGPAKQQNFSGKREPIARLCI